MKTIQYIFTGLVMLSISSATAGITSGHSSLMPYTELAPSVPSVALFEENLPEPGNLNTFILKVLAPETPEKADFNDTPAIRGSEVPELLPEVPVTAEFNDSI